MEDNRKKMKLHKSLRLYFSKKLKKIPPIDIPSPNHPANATRSRLFSACKYPRTPSFTADRSTTDTTENQAATLSDVDRFLFENFRSLYIRDGDDKAHVSTSPGTSTSLVNETRPSVETSSPSSVTPNIGEAGSEDDGDGVAVMTFSMDPYADFRRSMQNMMEMHHGQKSRPLDWDFMEELLFYYLQLNDRSVHKYILKAFADLTAGFRHGGPAHRRAQWAGKSVRNRKYASNI